MGNIETTIYRLKSISGIEDNYSFTSVYYLFSGVSLQLQKKLSSLLWRKCSLKLELKKSLKKYVKSFWKVFLNLFSAFFTIIKKNLIFYGGENVHWNKIM